MISPLASPDRHRKQSFDAVTITLHWITAALVLTLFGTAIAWTYLPREWGLRSLSGIHVSLGIALALTLAARIIWRTTAGRHLPGSGTKATRILARVIHVALYALLILQVLLGVGIQWLGGETLSFFGIVEIASPLAENRDLSNRLEDFHNLVAWSLMALVAGHAMAALFHHYIVRDGVLQRMVPVLGSVRTSPAQVQSGESLWKH